MNHACSAIGWSEEADGVSVEGERCGIVETRMNRRIRAVVTGNMQQADERMVDGARAEAERNGGGAAHAGAGEETACGGETVSARRASGPDAAADGAPDGERGSAAATGDGAFGAADGVSEGKTADEKANSAGDPGEGDTAVVDNAAAFAVCAVCPRACRLAHREFGACGVRRNVGGRVVCDNYGKLVTIQVKTLGELGFSTWHEGEGLQPDTKVLDMESYGIPFDPHHPCAVRARDDEGPWPDFEEFPPIESMPYAQRLAANGTIAGVAFSGPEPLYSYEYVIDCLRLARSMKLPCALVTSGFVTDTVLERVVPYLDTVLVRTAADRAAYEAEDADPAVVEHAIELLYASGSCTVEVSEE